MAVKSKQKKLNYGNKPAVLDDLRRRIAKLERPSLVDQTSPPAVLPFDMWQIDEVLPWGGLPPAALHEIVAAGHAATGFCAALLGRAASLPSTQGKPVLWCQPRQRGRPLYAPGLASFGLNAENLIVVATDSDRDLLWCLEESLRSGALAAVLGETGSLAPTSLRRLQLAVETGGGMAFLLRSERTSAAPGPALTRWRVGAAPSRPKRPGRWPGPPCWQLELLRCRGGSPGDWPEKWLVEWFHETIDDRTAAPAGRFTLAAEIRQRPLAPAANHVGESETSRYAA